MAFLPYVTTKRVMVDYNWAGIMYYTLYALIILFYGELLYQSGGYLKKEPVTGLVNPYVSASTHPVTTCAGDPNGIPNTCADVYRALNAKPYCSSPARSYHYDNVFKYVDGDDDLIGPECQVMDVYEVSTKSDNIVTFSTVFLEWQKYAWPCEESSNTFATEALAACGLAHPDNATVEPSGQCSCKQEKAVFPVGVEDYLIKMPHTYIVYDLFGEGGWRGTSGIGLPEELDPPDYPELMKTVIHYPNETTREIAAGESIGLTLKEILNMVDLNLDSDNEQGGLDARAPYFLYSNRFPSYRQTGLSLTFDLEYSNRDDGELIVAPDRKVDAKVTVENETTTWSSIGPSTTYSVYPSGRLGNQTYHRIIKYPQDVKVKFRAHGFVYAFDYKALLDAAIGLVVMTRVAALFMDLFIFILLPMMAPSMIVLKNKRSEKVTRRSAFMEMGIESAVAVNQFRRLKGDDVKEIGDGLAFADLTKVFGYLPEVDKDKALMIAKTCLGSKAKKGKKLDFNEFMTIMHGDAITFKEYLNEVDRTGGNLKSLGKMREDAEKAYDEAAKGIVLDDDEEDGQKKPAAAGAPPTPPPGAPPQAQSTPQIVMPSATAMPMQMQAPRPVMAPAQPSLPPGVIRIQCYNCKRQFGAPSGARKVGCPFCGAINGAPGVAVASV